MIRFFRSLLSGVFFFSYGAAALPFAPLLILPWWSPRVARGCVRLFYRIFVFFARLTALYRVEIDEATRTALTSCRGKIIVANHVSLIDVCILMAHLPDTSALAKAAAKKNPFLGMVVKKILISNDNDPEVTVRAVGKLLSEGVNVIVFPQGTRGGKSLKRGAARFALACGAPIAAFRLSYDPLVLAKDQPWWDVGAKEIVIRLSYCGELQPEGASTHAAAVALTEKIGEKIK